MTPSPAIHADIASAKWQPHTMALRAQARWHVRHASYSVTDARLLPARSVTDEETADFTALKQGRMHVGISRTRTDRIQHLGEASRSRVDSRSGTRDDIGAT